MSGLRSLAALAIGSAVVFGCGQDSPELFEGEAGAGGAGGDGAGGDGAGGDGAGGDGAGGDGAGGDGAGGQSGAAGEAGAAGASGQAGAAGAASAGGASTAGAGGAAGQGGAAGAGGAPNPGPALQSGSHNVPAFIEGAAAPHCEDVMFPEAFEAAPADIGIQLSAHHPGSASPHQAITAWVETVSTTGFQACMREDTAYDNIHVALTLNWVAYEIAQFPLQGLLAGRQALAAGAGVQCHQVAFSSQIAGTPHVQTALSYHGAPASENDPQAVWVEGIHGGGFEVCAQELSGFDRDRTAHVDWIAHPDGFTNLGFSSGEATFGAITDTRCALFATGCANCENLLLSVHHRPRSEAAATKHDPTLVWAEDFSAAGDVTICVREIAPYDLSHDAHLRVSWLTRARND